MMPRAPPTHPLHMRKLFETKKIAKIDSQKLLELKSRNIAEIFDKRMRTCSLAFPFFLIEIC